MFSNCYKYNPPDHDVVSMARKLQVMITSYIYNKHYMDFFYQGFIAHEVGPEKMPKYVHVHCVCISK